MLVGLFSYIVIGRIGDRDKLGPVPSEQVPTPSLPPLSRQAPPSDAAEGGHAGQTYSISALQRHYISVRDHLSDVMCHSYSGELCFHKSLSSVMEPFDVVVIFDLSEHGFRLDRSPASMHQAFITCQQFSSHRMELIVAMIHLNDSRIVLSFVTHASQRTSGAVFRVIHALR